MRIGSLDIEPALVLAPMSGVTDMAFRRLVRECSPRAVGLVVSEFISIEGLTRQRPEEPWHDALRSVRAPDRDPDLRLRLDRMAEAAAIVQATGVDVVDINCGCPVPKVVKRGGGAELMRREAHLERMLRAVRRELSVPLTLKMRTGWDVDSINCVTVAQMAEAVGVAMVTVHGRTRVQLYTGSSDWEQIAAVKQRGADPGAGQRRRRGRGQRARPLPPERRRWARDRARRDEQSLGLRADRGGPRRTGAPRPERRGSAGVHCGATRSFSTRSIRERVTAARLRGMVCRMSRGFPGSVSLRDAAAHTRTRDELLEVLDRFESGALDAQPEPATSPGMADAESAARSGSDARDALAGAG